MTLAGVNHRTGPGTVVPDPIDTLLRRIDDLEARVAALEPANDAAFVAAIAASVKGRVFNVAELRTHARIDADLGRVLRGLTSRQLGNRLRTLANRPINGLVLQRVGRDEAGCIWTVLHAASGLGSSEGA